PARARTALERLRDRHPDDVRIRRRLAFAHAEAGRFAELSQELSALADRAAGDERISLSIECAEVLAERGGDAARAVSIYREVLEARPGHPVAAAALERVLRQDRRFDELLALLRDEAAAGEGERGVAALYKIAEIHERELRDPAA